MGRVEMVGIVIGLATLWLGCSTLSGFVPETDDAARPIDFAIITVLPQEYHAVLRKLDNVKHVIEPHGRANRYVWATGEISSSDRKTTKRIVLALAGESGEVAGALATQATIDRWNPRDVLMVGIAGGVHSSVALGDIVVSSQIWGYEHGHLGTHYESGGILFFQPDPALVASALDVGTKWRGRIDVARPEGRGKSKVFVGKTASGNKVVESASSAYFAESLRLNATIMAVDMEGTGAGAAVGRTHDMGGTTGFLMIRGISDLVGRHDRDGHALEEGRNPQRATWKQYASDVAASFALELIANPVARPSDPMGARHAIAR